MPSGDMEVRYTLPNRGGLRIVLGSAGEHSAFDGVCWRGCGRDMELAKFEAYLKQHETLDISALVRGSQRLAYPIKGCVPMQHKCTRCNAALLC